MANMDTEHFNHPSGISHGGLFENVVASSAVETADKVDPTSATGTASRRPSLRRDISHELESFTNRKEFLKTSILVNGNAPFSPRRRRSLTDDLLRQTHFESFLYGMKSCAETKQAPIFVSFPAKRPVAESVTSEKTEANGRTLAAATAATEEKVDEENEEEAKAKKKLEEKPPPSKEEPLKIHILRKEPELIPLRAVQDEEEREFDQTMERRLNRARQLRRTTVMHYDQQEDTFRRRRAPQLFEIAVLIELETNKGQNEKLFPSQSYAYVPKIAFVYPTKTPSNLQPFLATLPPLCYADLGRAKPQNPERYKDEQFLMIVTDNSGDRKYAYCHRFAPIDLSKYAAQKTDQSRDGQEAESNSIDLTTTGGGFRKDQSSDQQRVLPKILCIVTPVNASSFYFDLAHEAALRAKSGNTDMLTKFLSQSFRHRLPPANGIITVKLDDDENNEEEESERADTGWEVVLVNRTMPQKGQGLGELLDRLGVDRLMKLFCALLCEKRVLLVADSVPLLSRGLQAASTMLAPFDWPHTLIPIVPDPFLHLCFSPAPYLMGVLRDHLPNLQALLRDDDPDLENQEEYMLILDIEKPDILKDKDWATTDLFNTSTKLLPNRISRSLKQLLRTALKSATKREQKAIDAFQWTFVELIGHYRDHIDCDDMGKPQFNRDTFVGAPSSRSQKNFLRWFVETGMFQVWINKKVDAARGADPRPSLVDTFDKKLDSLKAVSGARGWSWAF